MEEVVLKKGISETLRALQALKGNIVELFNINWHEVIEELKDADPVEVKELVIEVLSIIVQIIAAFKVTVGPIGGVYKLLRLLKII